MTRMPESPPTHPAGAVPAPAVERLLTYRQAGNLLGVTERTVWSLVDRGDLPAVRFGRSVRIDPLDLRSFVEAAKKRAGGNGGAP